MEIETLADAWTHGVKARMVCAKPRREGLKSVRECLYSLNLDMETLIATRGKDFPIARLAERLRCPRCGSREIRVAWSFPSQGDERKSASGW